MNWYKQAKYGLMIHWGLYTLASGEWNGKRMNMQQLNEDKSYNVGEWIQNRYQIPVSEYSKLAKAFNPVFFNAEEWVMAAKRWGMKYIVITSKHHDGFSMFDTKVDDYNVVKMTPYGRDVIKEIADACRKFNMKFCIYYSQVLDWHEKNGGDYVEFESDTDKAHANTWDFPQKDKDYAEYFYKKVIPQVTELLTNYGDVSILWFDGVDRNRSSIYTKELYELVKKLQPDCLVNSRIGHGYGDIHSFDDNEFPDNSYIEGLYETPATLNNTWGYVAHDQFWKPSEKVLELKEHLNSRGVNYLLNVGPDPLGRIPVPAKKILDEVAKKL